MACNPVEVVPRVSPNCTEEIPITWTNTSLYMDPISYVISATTRCNDIVPPLAVVQGIPIHLGMWSPKGPASGGGPSGRGQPAGPGPEVVYLQQVTNGEFLKFQYS